MNGDRDVWFQPQPDITVAELCEILRRTVFRMAGKEGGVYRRLPPALQRHFELTEPRDE